MVQALPMLPLSPSALIPGVAAIMVAGVLIARFLLRSSEEGGVYARLYDPARRAWVDRFLKEIEPGVYVDEDRRYLALIPANATPDTRVRDGRPIYPAVKVGSIYAYIDPVRALGFRAASETVEASNPVDFVMALYQHDIIPSTLRIRPDLEVYVYMDGRRLAEAAMDLYSSHSEEALSGIAAMTGKAQEYMKYVKMLAELEERKAGSSMLKIMAIAFGIAIVLSVLTKMFGGH